MRNVLALTLFLVGCDDHGSTNPERCLFDNVLSRDVPSSAFHCGALASTATVTEREAARDCVVDSLTLDREFVVSWDIRGIDSRVARAYYGARNGASLDLRSISYDGDPGGGGGEGRPSASTASCGSLATVTPCGSQELEFALCITCSPATVIERCSAEI